MNSSGRVQSSFTGFLGRTGEPGGLEGGLAGVLAAVAAAGVGHDHADLLRAEVEGPDQLLLDAEGALGAGPDGQAVALPLRHGGPGLERGVGDVGDGVARLDLRVGGPPGRPRPRRRGRGSSRFAEGVEDVGVGEGDSGSVQSARMAFNARDAVASSGAATPTKSPSRTTTTPSIDSAGGGVELRAAGAEGGGRRTLPKSIPGRVWSEA